MNKRYYLYIAFYIILILGFIIGLPIFMQKSFNKKLPEVYSLSVNPDYYINFGDFEKTYYNKSWNKDREYRLGDYYITASRNSFCYGGNNFSFISTNAIRDNINKGARFLQLDVYSEPNNNYSRGAEPIVKTENLQLGTKPLKLEDCFEMISNVGWIKSNNFPLILYLKIKTDNIYCLEKVANMYLRKFSNRIIDKKYGFNGQDGKFPVREIPIKETLGKIILVTDIYPLVKPLDEFVNGNIIKLENQSREYKNFNFIQLDKNASQYGGISGVRADIKTIENDTQKSFYYVESTGSSSPISNMTDPLSTLYNTNFKPIFNNGIQLIGMNYNLYDDNMKQYIAFFKNSPLKLKDEKFRFKDIKPDDKKEEEIKYQENISINTGFEDTKSGRESWIKI
jgi:hypothetical protein